MSWKDVTRSISERSGVSDATTRKVLAALTEEIEQRLVSGEEVRVPGVGTFRSVWKSERQVRGVRDGRRIALDAHFSPSFTPSEGLRRVLRERTPQLLRAPEHQQAWRLAETLVGDLTLYHRANLPTGIQADTTLDEVDAVCGRHLGEAWQRARETWWERTAERVREERNYLAMSARRRWATEA